MVYSCPACTQHVWPGEMNGRFIYSSLCMRGCVLRKEVCAAQSKGLHQITHFYCVLMTCWSCEYARVPLTVWRRSACEEELHRASATIQYGFFFLNQWSQPLLAIRKNAGLKAQRIFKPEPLLEYWTTSHQTGSVASTKGLPNTLYFADR